MKHIVNLCAQFSSTRKAGHIMAYVYSGCVIYIGWFNIHGTVQGRGESAREQEKVKRDRFRCVCALDHRAPIQYDSNAIHFERSPYYLMDFYVSSQG